MAHTPAPPSEPDLQQPDARAQAAAYLDLWEENLARIARHGPLPPRDGSK